MIKHSFTKIPKDIKKESVIDAIMSIITVVLFDFFAFFLQLGKEQIIAGNIVLGLVLIALYYVSNSLQKFLDLWFSDIRDTHREHYTSVIMEKCSDLLLKCRGKAFRPNSETDTIEVMNTNILLETSKMEVRNCWGFLLGIPSKIVQVISLIVLFIGFVFVTELEIEHTGVFFGVIILLLLLSIIFSYIRIRIRKKFRKERKTERERQTTWENDLINIEPVSEAHAELMASRFISATRNIFQIERGQRKKFNKINVFDSVTKSLAIIAVMGIKIWETGIGNVDLPVVLSIISLVAIFSQIMSRINSLVRMAEEVKSDLDNIEEYKNDFERILEAYDSASKKLTNNLSKFSAVEIPSFSVTYKQKGKETPFTLKNKEKRSYGAGQMILCTGPTGSGKSTLLKMLTDRVRFENFTLNLPKDVEAIMHQTDAKLGSGSILSEIILSDSEKTEFDSEKLKYILKGLRLYNVISDRSAENIFEFLNKVSFEDFSSGQKQRLVIARLLYNLDERTKIVAFDEATNALNDDVCKDVMKFIKQFCCDKVIFVATHQVEIVEPMCDAKISFEEAENNCFECK